MRMTNREERVKGRSEEIAGIGELFDLREKIAQTSWMQIWENLNLIPGEKEKRKKPGETAQNNKERMTVVHELMGIGLTRE